MKASSHWIDQRLSAIALIPFSIFVIYKILFALISKESILIIADSPISLFCITIFGIISLYHAHLGFDVIFDDYVSCNFKKYFFKGLIRFFNIATLVFFLFALYTFFQKQEIGVESQSTIFEKSDQNLSE